MSVKASIPRGVRDFSPVIMQKRQFILDAIKKAFIQFAYVPIETPAMENLSTLTGKYGTEGDRLIFKILNSGNYLGKIEDKLFAERKVESLTQEITNKGLRYDLTVPFARFVASHFNDLILPFRRYQMQPVWRADRPQKGRFREFYQCDADVIGSTSLWLEVELLQLCDTVFSGLNIPITIKINHRKLLNGIIEKLAPNENHQTIITALDKLEKIGKDEIINHLDAAGIKITALQQIDKFLETYQDKNMTILDNFFTNEINSPTLSKGIDELKFVLTQVKTLSLKSAKVVFSPTLARGLDYYTGHIFEVIAEDVNMGSIGGGGRYDNLTKVFGLEGISGVGISFGLDRIFLVMEELQLFPAFDSTLTKVLFVNFGETEAAKSLQYISELRKQRIIAELYPDSEKLKKQFHYADRRKIPFVAMVGSEEIAKQRILLKDLQSGKQESFTLKELIVHFR